MSIDKSKNMYETEKQNSRILERESAGGYFLGAQNVDEVIKLLSSYDEIEGSKGKQKVSEILGFIDVARKTGQVSNFITNTGSLRDQLKKLVKIEFEKKQKEEEEQESSLGSKIKTKIEHVFNPKKLESENLNFFSRAQTFTELISFVKNFNIIEGSKKQYSQVTVLEQIRIARLTGDGVDKITDTGGLRSKVKELLAKEQKLIETKIGQVNSFAELFQLLDKINYIQGPSNKIYFSGDLKRHIEGFNQGKYKLYTIPESAGLQKKVRELYLKSTKENDSTYLAELKAEIAAYGLSPKRDIYLELAKKYHPDTGTEKDQKRAQEMMILLNSWKESGYTSFSTKVRKH